MNLVVKKFDELKIDELYEILKVRVSVFVVEQKCPYQEIDDKDKNAYHIYLVVDKEIKAYLRVLYSNIGDKEVFIGRVLSKERGKGYAKTILKEGIRISKEILNASKIKIEAQVYVQKMYENLGFKPTSEEFLEDGIPHIEMELNL